MAKGVKSGRQKPTRTADRQRTPCPKCGNRPIPNGNYAAHMASHRNQERKA